MRVAAFVSSLLLAGFSSSRAADISHPAVPGFLKLPADVVLGAVSAVATDARGHLFIFHRGARPILEIDPQGRLVNSFGDGLFKMTHGLRVDPGGHLWTTDAANHTVRKFTRAGRLLRTLGEVDVPGDDGKHFNKPTDVAFAANGDFYVSDGYGNSRVAKFDADGKFLFAWGSKGKGPGEFNLPHAVQVDREGRVFVGDRENNRVQVFDSAGKFLREFGGPAPYGLCLTAEGNLVLADGRAHRIFLLTPDGRELASWGGGGKAPGQFLMPHGITVDAHGVVYVAEITGARVQKFVSQK